MKQRGNAAVKHWGAEDFGGTLKTKACIVRDGYPQIIKSLIINIFFTMLQQQKSFRDRRHLVAEQQRAVGNC